MPKKNCKTVLPEPLPKGEVVTDIAKKKWILGPSIGVGGFGEIYAAAEYSDGSKKSLNYQYVVKIEPHGNGPLFCEMHFFMRNAKPEMIKTWCAENKVSSLGMPRYLGSGSHEYNGKKYRFLVMDKYGKDLAHLLEENNKQFPISTVYKIALQLLEVLEYIHSNGYVHADIKAGNILTSLSKQSKNQIFLVDYGLASHYTKKEFKPDPKKAHNGTIEYNSRDAHEGVPTRRGDIEILAYNMIAWMGIVLPWENNISDPILVHKNKKNCMENIPDFLKKCFRNRKVPDALQEFLKYVAQMKYDTEPDYKKLHTILIKGLKSEGSSVDGALEFNGTKKRRSTDIYDSDTPEKKQKPTPKKKKIKKKNDENKPNRRGRVSSTEEDSTSGDETECDYSMEKIKRRKQVLKNIEEDESETENEFPVKKIRGRKPLLKTKLLEISPTNGFTAEMLRIQQRIAEKKKETVKKTGKKSSCSTSDNDLFGKFDPMEDVVDGTPPENLEFRRKKNVNNYHRDPDSEKNLRPRRKKK